MPSRDFVLLRPRNGEKNEANRVAGTRVGEERERERWKEGGRVERGFTEELYATGEGKEHTVEGNKKLMGV